MKYVLIGNSAAAVGCIEGIRRRDPEGEITVVSAERYHTYSRPLISYLLCGKTDEERMKYRPYTFYSDNGCRLISGVSAQSILPEKRTVLLSDKSLLTYDKLLIATGSRPAVPPIKGLESVRKRFTFSSLDDARALEKAIGPESRVLIMGAGLIGLKCAEGISGKVNSIAVVDMADHILPSILDTEGASLVQSHMERRGIRFLLSDPVKELYDGAAKLSGGTIVEFDVLVIAVGVRPNVELVRDAGGEVNRGICTDEYCRTTLPDVYAAGDCAESFDAVTGEQKVLALLPNAYLQGECAGTNMAGGAKSYRSAIPMNSVGFFGLHIMTAGSMEGTEYITRTGDSYKRLIVGENRLKGFIMIGNVARAGIYTSMIRERTPLDTVDFELILEKPQLMAFTRVRREEILAGSAEKS